MEETIEDVTELSDEEWRELKLRHRAIHQGKDLEAREWI